MKKNIQALLIILIMAVSANTSAQSDEDRRIVLIKTDLGDIKVALYNETPKHRDNFIKLAEEGFYDSTLFHRVISNFMIQGGDPKSKDAKPGEPLGSGGPGYTVPAEIVPGLYHKKGAIAAARQGDNVNPNRESSGSQFYIVQGTTVDSASLSVMAKRTNQSIKLKLFRDFFQKPENKAYKERYDALVAAQDREGFAFLEAEVLPMIDAEYQAMKTSFTQEQLETYSTIGGTPHLDGQYTVFGEVIEGMEVVDKIAAVVTNRDRPVEDIRMEVKVLK